MSGAMEYIMEIDREKDATKVLAEDGANVDVLVQALALIGPSVG